MLFSEIANISQKSNVMSDLPNDDRITLYDRDQMGVYLSLLYAAGEGISIEAMAREILGLDPDKDPNRAIATVESHLARARWLAGSGYKLLLESEPESAVGMPPIANKPLLK